MNPRVVALLSVLLLSGCEPKQQPATTSPPATQPRPVPAASVIDSLTTAETQAADTAEQSSQAEQLQLIRVRVGQLNQVQRWQKVVKRDLYNSTEGGEAQYYYQNGQVAKITERDYGETGQWQAEYYLWPDGQLAFVFETETSYNRPFYYDSATAKANHDKEFFDLRKGQIEKTRSYFVHGQLIQQLTDVLHGVPKAKKPGPAEQKRLQADFMDLLHTLNQPQ